MNIEPLEARIAPASALVTYTDIDGDLVKISASTPGALPLSFAGKLTFVGGGTAGQLAQLNLTDLNFSGANVTFTVTKAATGDGLAHVGEIAALGVDLGAVTIKGDLGAIDAGNVGGPALKSLTALSMGVFGAATGAVANSDGTLQSSIRGGLGTLQVKGDVVGVWINVSEATGGDGTGKIGAVSIGGSLVGGETPRGGHINAVGDIGAVKIGRDLLGAAGNESGKIDAGGKLKSLSIGGSIHGGGGVYNTFLDGNGVLHSGQVFAVGDIGTVKITRDVVAGSGVFSAAIHSHGRLGGSVTIGGSILDSGLQTTDTLIGDAGIGVVKIGRNLQGDIASIGAITSITVGGNATGTWTSTGALGMVKIGRDFGATIEAGTTLAGVTVNGFMSGRTLSGAQTGLVKIGRDFSGSVDAGSTLAGVIINGSMSGSTHSGGQTGLIKIGDYLIGNAEIDSDAGIAGLVVGDSITGFSGVSIQSVGQIGKIEVRGSAELMEIKVTAGGVGTLSVGGLLFVGSLNLQGTLGSLKAGALRGPFTVAGDVGAVTIAHEFAAGLIALSRTKSLTVGGNFDGTLDALELSSISIKGAMNGLIDADTLGVATVGGDLRGFLTGGEIGAISIGGSVIYQDAFGASAGITAVGRLGVLKIGGDVLGPGLRPGDVTGGAAVRGLIEAGSFGSITIGGSLRAGVDESSVGSLVNFPLILSQHEIGSVTIKGDLRGTVGSGGDITPAAIVALNQLAGLTTDLAIGSITIGGTVARANILAGTGPGMFAGGTNGNASIGAVQVGGNWIASNLTAGVKDTNGDGFGNADDAVVNLPPGAGTDAIIAQVASISIKGHVLGTAGGTDHFGFVAQQIGRFKTAGFIAPLTAGTDATILLTPATDVTIREVL